MHTRAPDVRDRSSCFLPLANFELNCELHGPSVQQAAFPRSAAPVPYTMDALPAADPMGYATRVKLASLLLASGNGVVKISFSSKHDHH
jgi:hypothetical protein